MADGALPVGQYKLTPKTLGDGEVTSLMLDSAGNLKIVSPVSATGSDTKLEDAASASGDAGSFVLGVRNDTNLVLTSATGDYGGLAISDSGQQIIKEYSAAGADWQYAAAAAGILNTTTAVTMKTAGGAGIRNYLTLLDLTWETLGAATELVVRDGASGTVIYRTKIGTVAGSKTIQFLTPLRGTAATLMEIATLTASVTGAVYVNAQGYTGP